MRNQGFTLLEVVLAIGLSGVVLGLLTTAIDLYLVRVDTSRTQVETAQLARTLLNQIADDIRAARYFSPSSSSSEEGDSTELINVQGIFGTATELRIDRSAVWQWESLARQNDVANSNAAIDTLPQQNSMPQTVRYLFGEGKELLTNKLAAAGVSEQPTASGYAGLYREQLSTAAWMDQNSTTGGVLSGDNTDSAELIAPEVVDVVFAYFDGEQLLDEWDSEVSESLPIAIEIRLTLLKEPFEQAATRTPNDRDELRRNQKNLVEYRLFVRMPDVEEPQGAEFPQPVSQSTQPPPS